MKVTYRQQAAILAGLRLLQEEPAELVEGMPHFEGAKPLTPEEIDELCEKVNINDWVEG